MLIAANTLSPDHRETADVIIVGAGAVGLVLGLTLARRGVRVSILEAGPERPRTDYRSHNHARSIGKPHGGAIDGRMKALGGTTRLWGGQLVAFGAADMDGDPATGRPRWPVRHATLQPFVDAALTFLGLQPDMADEEAVWRSATGLPPTMGPDLRVGMNMWLRQPDFAQGFGEEIRTSATLRVIVDAEVSGLDWSADGKRVESVRTAHMGGSRHFAAPIVVLASGTLEIARLLLRTAAMSPGCGFAGNQRIGRGFIDHLHGVTGAIAVPDAAKLGRYFDNIYHRGIKYGVKIRMTDAFRRTHGIANGVITLQAAHSVGTIARDAAMLMRRLFRGATIRDMRHSARQVATLATIMVPLAWRYLVRRRSTSLFAGGVIVGVELEQLPCANSYLLLDPGVAPEHASLLVHWGFDGREVDTAAALCAQLTEQFAALGLGSIDTDPLVLARDPAFLDTCHDSNHQMGGACMADAADDGVVDADLRVFGTDNLFVAGAATFPSGSFANPTLTALAFAMRLADHLHPPRASC